MSWSSDDDKALLTAFLRWLERDGVGLYEVTEQRIAEFMEQQTVSIPSMWNESPLPKSVMTSTHGEGDTILFVKPL